MSGACVSFWNGQQMPLVGLGTWQAPSQEVKAALTWALEAGYRHIDTAYLYQNEGAIGEVLQDWFQTGRIRREELFVVTKLPLIGMHADKVDHFCKLSLQNLKLDYVDLYLIHCPVGLMYQDDQTVFPVDDNGQALLDPNTDHVALWEAMEHQVDVGRVKSIGLSNFNSKQIERIVESARIKPANLQVEMHAYFQQKRLRDVCRKHGITVCAYGPLGSKGRVEFNAKRGAPPPDIPAVLEDPVVLSVAKAHSKTPAQVLLRHLIQQEIVVIPKSVSQDRIRENFNVFDFVLSDAEMNQLNALDKDFRTFTLNVFKGITDHPEFPYHIPY